MSTTQTTKKIGGSAAPDVTKADMVNLPYEPLTDDFTMGHFIAASPFGPTKHSSWQLHGLLDGLSTPALRELHDLAGRILDSRTPSGISAFGDINVASLRTILDRLGTAAPDMVVRDDLGQTVGIVEVKGEAAATQATEAADPPKAFTAFKEVASWLDARDEEITQLIGVGRTTPYSWERDGREPRRGSVRKLFETHATLAAIRDRLGEGGLHRWLNSGEPSRRDLILQGDLVRLERDVRQLLFERRDTGVDLTWRSDPVPDPEVEPEEQATSTARPSHRKARRARIR